MKTSEIGNKASSLLFLKRHKFRIPDTFVVIAGAFEDYCQDEESVLEKLRKEISGLPEKYYAIRSSTNIEDSENHTFAGQFLTLTNVRGHDNILNAIVDVWMSAAATVKNIYHSKVTGSGNNLRCAVVVQEMVISRLAGVSFSSNPVTDFKETVIEAVEGIGEDLVQKGITPYRWRFKGDYTIEGPLDFSMIQIVKVVARDTIALKKSYKRDVDVEWAYDGENIYYLQIRGVRRTGRLAVYSNRMVREMLPGQIKPLVWDVNISLVNGTFIRLFSEVTGRLEINPEELTKAFHYRIYVNMLLMGLLFKEMGLPPDSLEFMLLSDKGAKPMFMPGIKAFRHSFRIIRFIYSKLNFERTFLKEFNILENRFKSINEKISRCSFLDDYQELFNELFLDNRRAVYLNIVVPLLMQFYNKRLKSRLARVNIEYDQIDFNRDFPELKDLTPLNGMDAVRQKYEGVPLSLRTSSDTPEKLAGIPEAETTVREFEKFISKFGHLSDSGTDFSVKKWQEDPGKLFSMIIQSPSKPGNPQLIPFSKLPLSGLKFLGLRRLFVKAGKFRVYREQISSLYIFGYGLFRLLFIGLGKEFVSNGIINDPEDIFYLTKREVDKIAADIQNANKIKYADLVLHRRKEMDESKEYILPSVIFGEEAPILEYGAIRNFKGVGTSPGTFRGSTRIVMDTADFDSVSEGDILVIPFSDISWTPILVKAGAIVSESGGMLSHCSIIARELGIPALVSVDNACSCLGSKDVTVDGSNGILTVHDYE